MVKSKRNIRLTFLISLVILLISSAASYISISGLLESERWVDHTFKVKEKLEFIVSRMKDAETGQRGYLLTGETQFLEPYNDSKQEVLTAFDQGRVLTMDNLNQQKDFPKLEGLINRKYQIIEKTIADKNNGNLLTTATLLNGKAVMDSIRALIKVMEKREDTLMASRQAKLDKFTSYSPLLILLAAIISMSLALFFYKRITRDLNENQILQQALVQKEKDTQEQIQIISNIAKDIADGNYSTRVKKNDE